MKRLFLSVLMVLFGFTSKSQTNNAAVLRAKIDQLLSKQPAQVGVAIHNKAGQPVLSFRGDQHFPLQSVFKLHIALATLAAVDQGKLTLQQKITISKKELLPGLYSPIREKYPNGVTLTLAEIITYMVAESDNVGCELLLERLGGPKAVETYIKSWGINDVAIRYNEVEQQGNWDLQFSNWTTPMAANQLLMQLYYNQPPSISKSSYDFIWRVLRSTKTGQKRLRGKLPATTVVAHKTGSSGTNKDGITAAVNDIGVIFLPNKEPFFISVFVSNSTANDAVNEQIIADIAKLTWDYFLNMR